MTPENKAAFDRYCGASQSLEDCLRFGEFAPKSPEHVEMKAEVESLWDAYQSTP